MGIMDKIFGREEEPEQARSPVQQGTTSAQPVGGSPDEQAVARYRYMLQTAPPETIEQAHAEAFAKLTPEQRRMVLQNLTASATEAERTGAKDDPQSLARMATRAEIRQPGTMERTFGGMGGGMGMGGMMAGSFLSSIAGVVVGSAIAQSFFGSSGFDGGADSGGDMQSAGESEANQDANQNSGDEVAADSGGDAGGGFDDFGGGDLGDF
ncbi:MAG: hypothetical protein H0T92_04310 [Pyrinomonadaceae bacterium]|nr:hypothetical protein [Pyrinomonadaceae bacterium]